MSQRGNPVQSRLVVQRQDDQTEDQQEFVCQRIQQGPELRLLVKAPGHKAVHTVPDGRQEEHAQRHPPVHLTAAAGVVQELDDEHRHQQNARDGDLVGQGHAAASTSITFETGNRMLIVGADVRRHWGPGAIPFAS
ncbi:MAG: hypothetical protein M5U12_10530 [Verrucomicrobia bacterium]|nr:hypothetical protein [Verrucomicrobiota bacterium]